VGKRESRVRRDDNLSSKPGLADKGGRGELAAALAERCRRGPALAGFVVAVLRRRGQENILEDGGPFR
jgi:hypothetical protein